MKKNKTDKPKLKKAPIIIIIELIVLFLFVGVVGYQIKKDFFTKEKDAINKVEEKDNIKEYGYTLDDRDTALFKKEYNSLKALLNKKEIDYKIYAETLTRMFVIDFYTLNNKFTSTDIGSLEFVHPDQLENFKLNAGKTMYKGIKSNLYDDRVQELPTVISTTLISNEPTSYIYNKKTYEAYKIKISWEYDKDLGYEKEGTFICIKDNKKIYIVSK